MLKEQDETNVSDLNINSIPDSTNLLNCDREPIRIPGSIQAHGVLLVLDERDLKILQTSGNVESLLGTPASKALGASLEHILGKSFATQFAERLRGAPLLASPDSLGKFELKESGPACDVQVMAHRTQRGILLELEFMDPDSKAEIHQVINALTLKSESAVTVAELCKVTAEQVRSLTGFDRVLIYQFDPEWNGTVIGQSGNGKLPDLLDHRFPASDIPAQARELYRLNRLRIIPDASYQPVPILSNDESQANPPLDLSYSTLRSVSPIHVEYMRNMETASSMSISVLRDGRLWGLISCHHREPKYVNYPDRLTCDLMARIFSLRLAALEHTSDFERRIEVRSVFAKLLAAMSDRGDFAATLAENPALLLAFTDAHGAAVVTREGCVLIGETPREAQVRSLSQWLFETVQLDVYSTECLSEDFPEAQAYVERASGLLAIAISKFHKSFVLWFRPEVIQTIKWGGDPHKSKIQSGDASRIHPRSSFATWRELVRNKSIPWTTSEVEGAAELRNAIVGTVLKKAEELAFLNEELRRSNRELEAFSYSVSHDLRAPLRHIVGYAEILKDSCAGRLNAREERCIATIVESTEYAGSLVDKLLGFSRLGRAELQVNPLDMNVLVQEIIADVERDAPGRKISWRLENLPTVNADLMMMRMAVRDLLANAVKYSRKRQETVIEIRSVETDNEFVFSVEDNGVGFDMAYADKLFGVFQRLHKWEEYEGTGIGLANVRRVMERHGGRTWAEGKEGVGATFFFTLPKDHIAREKS